MGIGDIRSKMIGHISRDTQTGVTGFMEWC
jgi:hypothetical protein